MKVRPGFCLWLTCFEAAFWVPVGIPGVSMGRLIFLGSKERSRKYALQHPSILISVESLTRPETNIKAPENGWLEDDRFLLRHSHFQGRTVSFGECNYLLCEMSILKFLFRTIIFGFSSNIFDAPMTANRGFGILRVTTPNTRVPRRFN